ncbi:hypothetical protein EV193_1011040 [Herbihabitans rhizosphaerae]|uniref:Uncharacterized protein n=1 Tax=Herbihabitans rhizosphaerae TaxID=1872711 RepID=A0A4V2EUN1_9PSEU|nr:hypothetical protein [Herbihabitans rhizosphaerae]RZS45153.1 hypothetical protein EV193_1011040 [Herbihabitans rhizosphaerae]
MSIDDFDRPDRTIPDDVRNRLRDKVFRGIDGRSTRWYAPIAAAAAVAVAAGAVAIAQPFGNGEDTAAPVLSPSTSKPTTTTSSPPNYAEPPLDPVKAKVQLDRCWAAALRTGAAARLPDRARWLPVFTVDDFRGTTVTAAHADGKPLFCETTRTKVTLTDPNAAPAHLSRGRTSVALISPQGTLAGVLDPAWREPNFRAEGDGMSGGGPAWHKDRLFVFTSAVTPRPGKVTAITADGELRVPTPWPPAVAVTEPIGPPPDRTSERGKALDACIAAAMSQNGVPDPESWHPGAAAGSGDELVAFAVAGDRVASCTDQGAKRHPQFGVYQEKRATPDAPAKPRVLALPPVIGGKIAVGGTLLPEARRMEITVPGRPPVSADVHDATFAALLLPKENTLERAQMPDLNGIVCTVYDARGTVLYTGKLYGE